MDYCSTCHRHLNGALVCPGCGAYAPDIAPPALTDHFGPDRSAGSSATGTPAAAPSAAFGGDGLSAEGEERPEREAESVAGPVAVAAGAPLARPGRAARRRQLARLKKHQRRAMVATAFALVGGGLSLATLDRHTSTQAQAATAPDDRSMVAGRERAEGEPDQPVSRATEHHAPRSASEAHASEAHASGVSAPRRHRIVPAAPSAVSAVTRPVAVPSSRTVAAPSPQRQTGAATSSPQEPARAATSSGGAAGTDGSAPGRTDTATRPDPAPTTGGTDPATSGTAPAPAATSPTELCLLGLCLG
ncbi:hypothetical protein GCM10010206_54580 [Streptomyces cinerochromogenes]|nr:hypothetical protein GCM10010206_54580 [Streptomyces cinerochromogenes]